MAPSVATTPLENYALQRSQRETERLNNQHRIFKGMFGYYINPAVAKILGPHSQIADVGTGTGIWLRDVSQEYPDSVQLHGFDISAEQFLDPESFPPNVKLHVHSFKERFPAEWHQRFDLVHVRYLAAAMTDKDWEPVVNNLLEILKPGGAIQWIEVNYVAALTPRPCNDGTEPAAQAKMVHKLYTMSGLSSQKINGARYLPELFSKAGMTHVSSEIFNAQTPELQHEWSMNILDALPSALEELAKRGVPDAWPADEVAKCKADCLEEYSRGGSILPPSHIVLGFKAA